MLVDAVEAPLLISIREPLPALADRAQVVEVPAPRLGQRVAAWRLPSAECRIPRRRVDRSRAPVRPVRGGGPGRRPRTGGRSTATRCGTHAGARRARGSTSSPSGSRPAPAGTTSSCPSRSCGRCARSSTHVRHRAPRLRGLGIRGDGRPRARHQRAVRRRRAGRARRWPPRCSPASSASTSTGSTSARSSASTSARPRRTSGGSSTRPRTSGGDPPLRRGRRAVRQAQRGQGQPRPLRQHRGQLPAPADGGLPRPGDPDDEHEERARPGVPAPDPVRRPVPVPGRRAARREIWRRIFPAQTPTDGLDADGAGAARRRRRQHPQHRARRRVPGRGRGRAGRDGAPRRGRAEPSTRSSSGR